MEHVHVWDGQRWRWWWGLRVGRGYRKKNPWKISKLRSLWQMSKSRLTHSLLAEDVNKYRNINTIQKTLLHKRRIWSTIWIVRKKFGFQVQEISPKKSHKNWESLFWKLISNVDQSWTFLKLKIKLSYKDSSVATEWCRPSFNACLSISTPFYLKVSKFQKQNFLVLIWTKNRTKLFFDFCPKDLKWVKWKINASIEIKYPLIIY